MSSLRYEPADLVKPEVIANPYPAYAALRAESPAAGYADFPPGTIPGFDAPTPAWALLKHAHVLAAARDHKTFSSANFQQGTQAPTLMLVNHDQPDHTRLRRLISKAFTPKRVRELKPWVDEMIAGLLERLPEGEIDAVAAIASEIPPRVMLHLLGLPQSDTEKFKRWANAFMLSAPMSAEQRMASNVEMMEYFSAKAAARKAALDAGEASDGRFIDALLLAEDEDGGKLSYEEVVRFCFTLVVAGSETTMYFATNVFHTLLEHPELVPVLDAERARIGAFLDETLRHSGPPQRLFRKVTKDVEIGGKTIRAGEWVALFFAAANHDPEVFPSPEEFRLDRENAADHLTYGMGIHYCLGGPLASLEVECMTNALLDRYAAIEPGKTPPEPQTTTLLQHSWTKIPVVLRRKEG
jgi:cytochrome P450